MYELSLVELESELSTTLPVRNLMCVRHRKKKVVHHSAAPAGGTSANASFGSAANANSTDQVNSNAQTVVNTGEVKDSGINLNPSNANNNSNNQLGTPLNYSLGN
jgi:hypothetical protein